MLAQQYVISTVAGGAPITTPVSATGTSVVRVSRIAVGPSGEIYFSGYGDSGFVYRIDSRGGLTQVSGVGGVAGARQATWLSQPSRLSADSNGNLYVADCDNNVVFKVAPNGVVSQIAGNGKAGYSGDGGPAIGAQLDYPNGLSVDSAGNLYIADAINRRIRKVATNGLINTVAGTGVSGDSGDGGPATSAQVGASGVVADALGNLYISDYARIRKVTTNGVITTIAGTGNPGYTGDGGLATNAQLNVSGMAIDREGNLYTSDSNNNRIRKVATNGIISTIAGTSSGGYSGDGGPALSAQLSGPADLAVDASGSLYIADANNNRIRKIGTNGLISTFAGNGSYRFSGDGNPAATAQLNGPKSVAVDTSGNVFISDFGNNRVRKVGTAGIMTTVAGNGDSGYSGDNAPAITRRINPWGVAVDSAGNLYIGDYLSNRIHKVTKDGILYTIAGTGKNGFTGDGGLGIDAELDNPRGLAFDGAQNLYVAERTRIRKIDKSKISTLATASQIGAL